MDLALLKAKFATTSLVATATEYLAYALFIYLGVALKPAQLVSYGFAMILNFFLQKQFVFELNRSTKQAFFLAILVSFGGMGLNFLIYSNLIKVEWLELNHYIPKLIATGIVFFYNFYLKRYVFERKFI